MTTVEMPAHQGPSGKQVKDFFLSLLRFVLNVAALAVLGVAALAAFGLLGGAEHVSQLENNGASWSFFFFWGALIGGGIASIIAGTYVHSTYEAHTRNKRRLPAWGVNTFLVFWAIIAWLSTWALFAIPVTHTVMPGEIRITSDGTVLTEGQTIAGSRREPTSLRQPLTWSGTYAIAVPINDTDWVDTTVTLGGTTVVTPEYLEYVRQNPPSLNDASNENYAASQVIWLLTPELSRLIRAEAAPGQSAVGEVNSMFGGDRASVPMGTRFGLQLEQSETLHPNWLQRVSISGVTVGTWHRRERAS